MAGNMSDVYRERRSKLVDRYNRAKSKDAKRAVWNEIHKFEEEMLLISENG